MYSDENGVGSVRTGVFVTVHVSCIQMSPCSFRTSLTGVVESGNDEMNSTSMSQSRFHDI